MLESKKPGMQRLPRKRQGHRADRLFEPLRLAAKPEAVERVAKQGMADMRHVDADLVRAPCFKPAFHQGGVVAEDVLDMIMRDGVPRIRTAGLYHRPLDTIGRGAAQRRVDSAVAAVGHAPDERPVAPFHAAVTAMGGKLRGKGCVRNVRLGNHHDARRILVQTMDDAGSPYAADTGQAVAAVVQQRVDQRPGPVAGRGVDHHAGRLVDHDDGLVFVKDVQRDRLRLWIGIRRLRQYDEEAFARRDLAAGLAHGLSVGKGHAAARDDPLHPVARDVIAHRFREELVQTFADGFRRDVEAGCLDLFFFCTQVRNSHGPKVRLRNMTDANTEAEGVIDPATERLRRKMVRLLAVSIGIMFVGVMAVLAAVVYRTGDSAGPEHGAEITLALPAGSEVAETSLSGDTILVRVFMPEGEEIILFDRRDGSIVNRYPLNRP